MEAEGPMKELCEEASCSICRDFFKDPVTISECGHNFCRDCLTQSWGESGAQPSCPQCKKRAQKRKLCPNLQLANFVKIAKKLRPLEGEGAEVKEEEEKGRVCKRHQEPLKFFCQEDEVPLCVNCSRSREHRDHQVIPLEEAVREKKTIMARKERVCQEHWEPLKLFCRDHEAPICMVCEKSPEHECHEIIPVEEASKKYKDQFCTCLANLEKERKKILVCKASIVKESQDLLRQTKGEREKMLIKFRQLRKLLEEQEKVLLAQIEEVEKEVARNRDQHLATLSEELSSLESLIWEMDKKFDQQASDFLQDAKSTLQRYEEKESFENPVAFPLALKWRIWDCSDLNPLLEGIKKQVKGTLDSGLHFQKVNVALDPNTAGPQLLLSEDRKSVRPTEKANIVYSMRAFGFKHCFSPVRFEKHATVLGHEEFTAGCHFWEVLVGSEEEWAVGVAKKSVRRKESIIFSHEEGIWAVGKWGGNYKASIATGCYILSLTLSGELKKIRVCLNYAGGRVAIFDADTAALIYEFSGASFSGETLLPFFYVFEKGHLRISS